MSYIGKEFVEKVCFMCGLHGWEEKSVNEGMAIFKTTVGETPVTLTAWAKGTILIQAKNWNRSYKKLWFAKDEQVEQLIKTPFIKSIWNN